MKLRYWVAAFLILLVAGYITSAAYTQSDVSAKVDMVELNDSYIKIETELDELLAKEASDELYNGSESTQAKVQALEEKYQCELYFRGEHSYENDVHNAIQERKILLDYEKDGRLIAKVVFDGQTEKIALTYEAIRRNLLTFFLIILLMLAACSLYIYLQYVRPFKKLKQFAAHIAKGDLDFPLAMTKGNYFGVFTESFDIMREELKRAKQGEYEANVSKKELVASLSHDIKTPVSTIKATCEILMLKLKDEATLEKIVIINQKAGMIDALISDMFHATLADLEALKITPQEELSTIIRPMFDEINYYGRIRYENELPECLIVADALRLNQVIDNVINNSYKYAGTDIHVAFCDCGESIEIEIRDEGKGVSEEEMPLLMGKFYRGSNAKGQSGSGLGLYLSKVFMEGMGGSLSYGTDGGFVVRLTINKSN